MYICCNLFNFLSFENFICYLMFRSIPIPSSPTPQYLFFPPSYSSSLPSLNPPSAACMCMGVGSSTGAKVTPDTVLFNTLWWAWRCCLRLYTMGTNPSSASLWCQQAPVLSSNHGSHCLLWQFWLQLSPIYFAYAPPFLGVDVEQWASFLQFSYLVLLYAVGKFALGFSVFILTFRNL